jgi:riboflavin kinase/FMN adenylyltransferase
MPGTSPSSPNRVGQVKRDQATGTVVCIGVFDGVHLGHQSLIAQARAAADEAGLPLVAVTIAPHPAALLRPGSAPKSLASLEHRMELLRKAGADEVEVLRFDEALAQLTPTEFARSVIVEQLRAKIVVVGANFLFGVKASGDVDQLSNLGDEFGFSVCAVALESDGEPWSSTRIRSLLLQGEIAEANHILGRSYRIEGTVVHGDHRGRELGFPTANLQVAGEPIVPADGVYAGILTVRSDSGAGTSMPAAVSVGTNPQFDGQEQRIESYVLDRTDLDLYGHNVLVDFVGFIRGQATFDSLEAFIAQMGDDVEQARAMLAMPARILP